MREGQGKKIEYKIMIQSINLYKNVFNSFTETVVALITHSFHSAMKLNIFTEIKL